MVSWTHAADFFEDFYDRNNVDRDFDDQQRDPTEPAPTTTVTTTDTTGHASWTRTPAPQSDTPGQESWTSPSTHHGIKTIGVPTQDFPSTTDARVLFAPKISACFPASILRPLPRSRVSPAGGEDANFCERTRKDVSFADTFHQRTYDTTDAENTIPHSLPYTDGTLPISRRLVRRHLNDFYSIRKRPQGKPVPDPHTHHPPARNICNHYYAVQRARQSYIDNEQIGYNIVWWDLADWYGREWTTNNYKFYGLAPVHPPPPLDYTHWPLINQYQHIYWWITDPAYWEKITHNVRKRTAMHAQQQHKDFHRAWILDTGASHDMIGTDWLTEPEQSHVTNDEDMYIQTANGTVPMVGKTRCQQRFLTRDIQPRALQGSCPPLLSIGTWCRQHGYSFSSAAWAKKPIFRTLHRERSH